jgi:hypothetical protein
MMLHMKYSKFQLPAGVQSEIFFGPDQIWVILG